jgi:two-component system cell cycle sensor histidine kinase/response regulator CckA
MEAVGRLAGGVAHDFNNLLTAILGYAELLSSSRELSPVSRQSVEMIQKAGRQAAAVTHQLLAFSRKQMLQPRVIDLNALVIDFQKILHRVIGEHIDLKTRPEAANARVKADPNQIEQVILNLGVNARDAMPKGGSLVIRTAEVELDASAARTQALDLAPGAYVLLEVSDTGKGMTDEVKSRIFEPFFTTKEPGKGTGLGLSTVYGVVRQSGGSVTVLSGPGAGSTFRIYLPLEIGELDQSRPKTVAPLEMPCKTAETVLVVEDEEIVRELVCQVLSDQGYDVLCANNGREGIRMSEEHPGPIQLLMTDVVMPVIGGLELARKLSASRPDMKVLYVSGYSESDISEQGILEEELEFLEKPFTPQVLIRKVREVLHPSVPAKGAGQNPPAVPHASSLS